MEELGQFNDESFKKKQEELKKKQAIYEYQEKIMRDFQPKIQNVQSRKRKFFTWIVLVLMLVFVLFLGWRLLG